MSWLGSFLSRDRRISDGVQIALRRLKGDNRAGSLDQPFVNAQLNSYGRPAGFRLNNVRAAWDERLSLSFPIFRTLCSQQYALRQEANQSTLFVELPMDCTTPSAVVIPDVRYSRRSPGGGTLGMASSWERRAKLP